MAYFAGGIQTRAICLQLVTNKHLPTTPRINATASPTLSRKTPIKARVRIRFAGWRFSLSARVHSFSPLVRCFPSSHLIIAMKLLLVLAALVAVSLASTITIEERVVGRNGGILFLTGQLGSVPTPVDPRSVRSYITETLAPVFGFTGRESFLHVKTNVDTRNNTHVFFQQFVEHHGSQLEVDGGEIIVHANEQGAVFAISSSVLAFHADAPYADVKVHHARTHQLAPRRWRVIAAAAAAAAASVSLISSRS